jgi:putative membrane protein
VEKKDIDSAPRNQIDRSREFLATERTYLAWIRTAISLMSFGVLIAKLSSDFGGRALNTWHFEINATTAGLAMICVGMLALSLACWRYRGITRRLAEGRYVHSDTVIYVMSIAVVLLGLFLMGYLVQHRSP